MSGNRFERLVAALAARVAAGPGAGRGTPGAQGGEA